MKIAFFSTHSYDRHYFNRHNTGHDLVYFEAALDEQTVELAKGSNAVCVFVNDTLNADVLEKLAMMGVQMIALRCAGYNNVDLEAATRYGLTVARVPAYSPYAVAEHAVALMLTLNRKIHKAYNRVREGNFSLARLVGFDLHGKTVGVIGTGKIGQIFAEIMLGFGCRVLAFDMIANRDLEAKGIEYQPLVQLLPQCDVISLHCPLNDQTHHLINPDTLSLIKQGAMLINTSRGALIDTNAAIEALKTGRLGSMGLDVYEQEEKLFFHNLSEELIPDETILRLMSFPNVLITSHQGFFTEEALTAIATVTLENIDQFAAGRKPANLVVG
ncbi:MAG: 2-hydroxyacid dehydrogenase [Candidatus Pseudobacter hemicellulosilyticus]|uniref:2-hydroxyacid dehydrogenase n=1 Tax=Candidatus Pseudobacter hemicellulosilyticus TaxID=3121375 RepID=A0AAJ6BH84_9BACT|nr:MAG: 2-hydroxyacid dehydrogenase [Pseudobacter sp.]